MKRSIVRRPLTALLALLMVVGMFTVCTVGVSAAGTRELAFQTWKTAELAAAGEAVGTKNTHDSLVFTTFYDVIGRRSTSSANLFIANANFPKEFNGERTIYNGAEYTVFVRLMASDNYDVGNLCQVDVLYGVETYGGTYRTDYPITLSDYEQAPIQVDETYGYEYKEFALPFTLDGEIYDEEECGTLQFRMWAASDEVQISVYSIEILDAEENMLNSYIHEGMKAVGGPSSVWEHIYSDPENPSGLASYTGTDEGCLPSRGEPYSLYNGDGLNRAKGEKYLMIDGLGAELQEGNYSFSFNQASMYSLGSQRVYYTVTDATTDEEIATLNITMNDVDATVGRDTCKFEIRSVPFTVGADRAGHKFTFQVYIYNQTDYYLRSASLNIVVDADATAPADAQAVIDAITNLDIADTEATEAARAEYEKLDTLGQAWVGAELASKLSSYEQAQASASEVNAAIAALGNKDELTADNYTEKTDALKAVEYLYKAFAKANGTGIANKLIHVQALNDYRAAYDAAEAEAEEKIKQAEIQKVVDAITAIGSVDEITKDNAAAKQELVDAAETAVNALISTYGQDITAEISNYATLADAKEKIAEVTAYTLGDANEDGEINASDALLALQHSVKLTELKDAVFSAADVDESGVVDATDALFILQYSVKLIDKFPAEK